MDEVKIDQTPEVTTRSLVKKLCKVMAEAGYVQKRGHNDKFNYAYATEADVVDSLREKLAARKVFVFPSIIDVVRKPHSKTSSGGDMHITDIMVRWTFVDGDSGEQWECLMPGSGTDTGDKGLYKAITGSSKYLFLKAFMLPTGDDPEDEKLDKKEAKEAAQAVAQRKIAEYKAKGAVSSPSTAKVAHPATGQENVVLEPFGAGLVALTGNGLNIVKSEMTPDDRAFFGIKLNPKNVHYMKADLADKFADLCRRCKVGCVNMGASKAERVKPDLPKANLPPFTLDADPESDSDDPILTDAKVIEKEGKKTFMDVTWDAKHHSTFDAGLFPILKAAIRKPVMLEVKANGKYSNIVRILRVNGVNFADEQDQVENVSTWYE